MKLKLLALAPMLAVSLLRGDANATLSQQEIEDLAVWMEVGDYDRPAPECMFMRTCRPDDFYSPYERYEPRPRYYHQRPYYFGNRPPYWREHRGPALEPPRPPYYGEPL